MPSWVIPPLIVAAALFLAWWAETKVAVIIAELKAIRGNLDKLWADRAEEDGGETGSFEREITRRSGG
jgi:hypothetical protein